MRIKFLSLLNVSLLILSLLGSVFLSAQKPVGDPVHWTNELKPSDKGDKTFELHLTAQMDPGWHIYSQTQPSTAIAIPTSIVFSKNPLIKITGKPKEIGEKEKYEDKAAGIVQYQYGNKLEFVQSLTYNAAAKTNMQVTITYQACTSEMCLPAKTINMTIPLEK